MADDDIIVAPDTPDIRPHDCTANADELAKCASAWLSIVEQGKHSHPTRDSVWRAAVFQGYVEGVWIAQPPARYCHPIWESQDRLYSLTATVVLRDRHRDTRILPAKELEWAFDQLFSSGRCPA